MGAWEIFTMVGIGSSLVLAWGARKRSRKAIERLLSLEKSFDSLKWLELERRLVNLEKLERETLQHLPLMLTGLVQALTELERENTALQQTDFYEKLEKVKDLLESIPIIEEDLSIDSRACRWLYNNRDRLAQESANIVLSNESRPAQNIKEFIFEVSTCLAMVARMMESDSRDILPQVWDNSPRTAFSKSFYILALREVIKIIEREYWLPEEERFSIKNHIEILLSYSHEN